METQELHRGRLIDHMQLVVKDLPASQTFYTAVFVLDPDGNNIEAVYHGKAQRRVGQSDILKNSVLTSQVLVRPMMQAPPL